MNGRGPSIERSTWDSAAKFSTAAGRCSANTPRHRRGVADVALHEHDARIVERAVQVQQVAGVGQLVEDDEAIGGVRERVVHEIGADEAGAAGDEQRSASLDGRSLRISKTEPEPKQAT